jgi:hypothetical protein
MAKVPVLVTMLFKFCMFIGAMGSEAILACCAADLYFAYLILLVIHSLTEHSTQRLCTCMASNRDAEVNVR